MANDEKQLNIFQRMNEVRKEIEYIKKDASVQNYMAVTHDAVTAMIRDSLINHGIIIMPDQTAGTSIDVGTTKSGTPIIRYEARYKFWFINVDNPNDMWGAAVEAHAMDFGDKAPGKSLSYATKSILLKAFNIETGVNDESRLEDERRGKLVIEHLKDEMHEFINAGDQLGLLLFSRNVGPEMWTELFNSATTGKMAFKNKLNTYAAVGQDILEAIGQAITDEDDLKARENLAGLTEPGKKLLANAIGRDRAKLLGKLLEEK